MSSCSRRNVLGIVLAAVVGVLAPRTAEALSVQAVYRTACDRELGVILRVDKRVVQLLRFDGTIESIPRHEIVSIAYYPVTQLPLRQLPANPSVPPLRVETLYRGEVSRLALGWPIDYSDTKIAFLLETGEDILIDRDSVWSVTVEAGEPAPPLRSTAEVEFAHPQTAGFCPEPTPPTGAERRVFAQQILDDRVVIKRELDRLQAGYEELTVLISDQKFYPVPQIYRNRTELGLWVSLFSRYGGSTTRTNNFTPMVVDVLSLGPFRYQHIFVSGIAPNPLLLHDEAQQQLYYRFKAAYFHASVFVDPNIVLVGDKYGWQPEDFADEAIADDRMNELAVLEFGFDFGPIAIQLVPLALTNIGVAVTEPKYFEQTDENLWRAGLRYQARQWQADVMAGTASNDTAVYWYGRANASTAVSSRLDLTASVIVRHLDHDYFASEMSPVARYSSLSVSSSAQAMFALSHRFHVGALTSLEVQSIRTADATASRKFPKVALFTSFSF